MKFTTLIFLTILTSTATAIIPPGASTPLFYLVASSPNSGSGNLKPLRPTGGTTTYSTLKTSNPIGQFYFSQGTLYATPSSSSSPQRALIAFPESITCNTSGPLGFTSISNTDKCASYNTFSIQSDQENSQLGARLSYNFIGQFYVCGDGEDVWYKSTPDEPPTDCAPIDLYTVPVI